MQSGRRGHLHSPILMAPRHVGRQLNAAVRATVWPAPVQPQRWSTRRTCAACSRVEVPSISVSSSSSSWPCTRVPPQPRHPAQPTTTNKQPALMCPARTRATWLQRSGKPWQAAGHSLQTHVAGQPAVLSPSLPQHLWNSPAAPHLQVQLLPHLLAQLSYPHHMVAQLVQVLVLPPAHKRRLAMERKCAAHRQRRKAAA